FRKLVFHLTSFRFFVLGIFAGHGCFVTRTGIDLEKAHNYKYFDLIMAAFVTCLLCSDIIGVQKVSYIHLPFIGEYIYGAGVLFFPISYFFGDTLTEVYGYKRSRRVIWAGF